MSQLQPSKGVTAVLVAMILAGGLASAGYFASKTLYNAQVAVNTAQAKGLAERKVKADMARWTVGFSASGKSREEIPALYEKAEAQQKQVLDLLKAQGFSADELRAEIIDHTMREYRDDNQVLVEESHRLAGAITVSTGQVDLVEKARAEVNKLLAQGLDISNGTPEYFFTKLNEIKPAMLKEAAQNARIAATEFATNAGAKVGKIRSASQGGFIVQDAGSSSGETYSILKDIRVVTTVDFYLND
jgi:hypothetical protein